MTNDEARALYIQAISHIKGNRFSEALALLDRLDGARPNSRQVTFNRARCFLALGRADEAESCAHRLKGKVPPEREEELEIGIQSAREALLRKNVLSPETPPEENVLVVDAVYPISTDETSIACHVRSGVVHTGDTLQLASAEGLPVLAPIMRIGTAETPVNLARAGQRTVMLLQVEQHLVAAGVAAPVEGRGAAYAETVVLASESTFSGKVLIPPPLLEIALLLSEGHYGEAHSRLEKLPESLRQHPEALRLSARLHIEGPEPLRDKRRALEDIRRAYENGGSGDLEVIETLAEVLAANGEPGQGLRFLERLYATNRTPKIQARIAQRIEAFRMEHDLGHVWEFADQYGDILFESEDAADIIKALKNASLPRDAKCRQNRIGVWRGIEEMLAPLSPEIAAYFKPQSAHWTYRVLAVLLTVFVLTVLAAIYWSLRVGR